MYIYAHLYLIQPDSDIASPQDAHPISRLDMVSIIPSSPIAPLRHPTANVPDPKTDVAAKAGQQTTAELDVSLLPTTRSTHIKAEPMLYANERTQQICRADTAKTCLD